MSDLRHSRDTLWRGPLLAWGALLLLAAISLGSAYLPLGAGNVVIGLVTALVMAVILAVFLMDLQNAKMLIRIVALAGLFWMTIMFALTFSDYLSRS